MSRLRVEHWIACLESQVVPPAGPRNFYNLCYELVILPQAPIGYVDDFPGRCHTLDMFVRFVGGSKTAEDFETRIVWLDAIGWAARQSETYGPFRCRHLDRMKNLSKM